MKTQKVAKSSGYIRPKMRTVVTPKEIRDIDQPCAFYKKKKAQPK